jgi:hypothetical protein
MSSMPQLVSFVDRCKAEEFSLIEPDGLDCPVNGGHYDGNVDGLNPTGAKGISVCFVSFVCPMHL